MEAVDPVITVDEEYCEPEEDLQLPPVRLKEGIDVKEFIDTSSAIFQVNVDDFDVEEEEKNLTYFNKEELLRCSNIACIDEDGDENDRAELGKTPFERIAAKMSAVTEDGKVKKKEIQPGHGSVVPKGSHVTVHYNAYVEYGDDPYDSTWLRGNPLRFKLESGSVIAGLEIAVATMRKGELSRFLFHPTMGFGKVGCPPRIPANAELLFEIELISYFDNTAAEAFEALTLEERQKQDFSTVLKAAQAQHLAGNERFKIGHVGPAVSKYKKAVNILEKCHLKDEDEEKQQQHTLLKLYVNLAVCYNKQNLSKLACVMCRHALEINPISVKALFNFGRALITLSDYKEAERRLLAALKIEPNNKEICEELKKLEKKKKSYKSEEKMFSTRAFKVKTSSEKEVKKAEVSEDFAQVVEEMVNEFLNDDGMSQFPIPGGMTFQEEFCIRKKAEEVGLIVRTHEQKGERQIYITKPEQ